MLWEFDEGAVEDVDGLVALAEFFVADGQPQEAAGFEGGVLLD